MATSLSSTHPQGEALSPVAESLLALAPLHLPNHRPMRSLGDQLCIRMAELDARDQQLVRGLYRTLGSLLHTLTNTSDDDARKWRQAALWARQPGLDALIDQVRELGLASHALGSSESLAKAIHDVRGGALSALLGRLQMVDLLPRDSGELKTLFVLTRDHLKVMRSALADLDKARYEADKRPRSHDTQLILDKWQGAVVGPRWREQPLRMHVDCRHEGPMTECCLESAAIDRIFYNLANNASRHAVGERVEMAIFPLPAAAPDGGCLRFVLSNEVNEADAAYLGALVAGGADSVDRGSGISLLSLFEPKVSSTGSGFGLTVVADFVTDAFGLRSRREALRERYVGAVLDGRTFRVWFHWPKANHDFPPMLDDPHQPQRSLADG